MIDYVAYYRVSTGKQGRSGLGLEAQRTIVENYIKIEDIIVKEFTDVQTGTYDSRTGLEKALDFCKNKGCKLIVAKLDRLTRDLHFITGLQKANVDFVICNIPDATPLTIHIFAAMAQHEASIGKIRTKEALSELKKKGVKLGSPYYSPDAKRKKGKTYTEPLGDKERENSIKARKKKAIENPNYKKAIQWVKDMRRDGKGYDTIAIALNEAGMLTSRGKRWHSIQVSRMIKLFPTKEKKESEKEVKQVNIIKSSLNKNKLSLDGGILSLSINKKLTK